MQIPLAAYRMGMGPEELLVRQRIDPRAELAAYVRLEYVGADAQSVEWRIRAELEFLPVRHTAGERLLGWCRERLGRTGDPVATESLARQGAVQIAADRAVRVRPLPAATLAAMPATQARVRPETVPTPISAAPLFARS